MIERAKNLWQNLSSNLGFVPGLIVTLFAALGIAVVEIDRTIDLSGERFVFAGDGSAARTVLSVIAGSLITVAGLTFSITMVVLQLASSQFSPRVLRSFFADRMTQVAIGAYVGTFVYAILVLRAVGSYGTRGFVPRLSVTLAALLGIGAAVLLIAFLHHVSRLVQVSYVTASIGNATLARADVLYPANGVPASAEDAERLLRDWRTTTPLDVRPSRPGYVQRVALEDLTKRLSGRAERVALLARPGDFVSLDMSIAQLWPSEAVEDAQSDVHDAFVLASERDLDQDVDFGLRQLADIALKAVSPGINDPATAITCIGYLRSVLCRLGERPFPEGVRRDREHRITVIVGQRDFEEYLEPMLQIARYADGDAWVTGALLEALIACARSTAAGERPERLPSVRSAFATVAQQARSAAANDRDRNRIEELTSEMATV